MNSKLQFTPSPAAHAGASIAAQGVGITALVMPVARVGDEFFKLSEKTGVSVEALTALDYAAKLSDVSAEGLTKALQSCRSPCSTPRSMAKKAVPRSKPWGCLPPM